jgi:hypothetical protein
MEKKELKEIADIWKEKGKNLIVPTVLLAYDRSGAKYFVIQNSSTIVFMVKNGSNTTFAIPKKYCQKDKILDYYKVYDIEKMTPVSCPRKNDYEIFVQKHLIK